MSRAAKWVQHSRPAFYQGGLAGRVAEQTGELEITMGIRDGAQFDPKFAIAFAEWILATFQDGPYKFEIEAK